MGRNEKIVVFDEEYDRRELGYYSTPTFISTFITKKMLEINPNGKSALDPCVGKGEMIFNLYKSGIKIDGIDVHNHCNHKYCNFIQNDFISFYKEKKCDLLMDQKINLSYDYYIANPPYNCHEIDYIKDNKKKLNSLFGKIGVHNMYSMFISSMIDCAKEGSIIAFISADSFMTSRMHNPLRKQIIDECAIHYILLCPTDLFWDQKADVRTCIMILQKGKKFQQKIKTLNRPKNKDLLDLLLHKEDFNESNLESILNYSGKDQFEFVIDMPIEIKNLFENKRISDLFKCLTGISTGNDSKYISKTKKNGFEIPFYKNPGNKKFYCENNGFIANNYLEIDKKIKNFMVRNKSYMLKEGITCSSMGLTFGACYLPKNSTFGVNSNIFCSKKDIWWLIAYLNSSLVTYIVRGLLIRSNMITSGYVSKIPIIPLSEISKRKLSELASTSYKKKVTPKDSILIINKIDKILFEELKFSKKIETDIKHFSSNLQATV